MAEGLIERAISALERRYAFCQDNCNEYDEGGCEWCHEDSLVLAELRAAQPLLDKVLGKVGAE